VSFNAAIQPSTERSWSTGARLHDGGIATKAAAIAHDTPSERAGRGARYFAAATPAAIIQVRTA
jgi:hypothetical protein